MCGSVTAATATAATAALHSAVCGDVYATNTHTHRNTTTRCGEEEEEEEAVKQNTKL